MKVPFVFGPDDLRLCDIEPPRAGPRDVVVAVASVGICGSDLGYIAMGGVSGPAPQPVPLGHELAGTIIAAGAEVASVKPGDRVIVNPLVNLIGNGGPEGGFAEHLLIRDVVGKPGSLLHLPDELSFDVGALVEPLAVATHAVNRLGAKAGAKVAIFGAGPIGLSAIVVLRRRGIADIVIFDLSPFRRERARELGATVGFDPREQAPSDALRQVHGAVRVFRDDKPQTTHFLDASGAPVLSDIVSLARSGAIICVVSAQKQPVTLDFQQVVNKELAIVGALGYPTEFPDVLDMLKQNAFDLEAVVSHRFSGEDVMAAFAMARQPERAAKVLVQFQR